MQKLGWGVEGSTILLVGDKTAHGGSQERAHSLPPPTPHRQPQGHVLATRQLPDMPVVIPGAQPDAVTCPRGPSAFLAFVSDDAGCSGKGESAGSGGSGESLAMTRPGAPILAPGGPAHVLFLISNREVNSDGKETRGRGKHWVPLCTHVIRHRLGVEKGDGPSANP